MRTRWAVVVVVIVALGGGALAQSSTAGAVRGIVTDAATGDPVIGATVVITGPALPGQQAELTDENGQYVVANLPPGVYMVTVFYNEVQFDRPNVLIQVGKQAVVNVAIDAAAAVGETIVVEDRTPIVDQGSTKIGPTITREYIEHVPVGRTFGAVLGVAAGAQKDQYGIGFSGSTSIESAYIVEGINTTDTAFGLISSNLPNEFVQETEVITGGYNAEFGRSTGGVVNVVTKAGSNQFHGSVFAYYTPGELVAASDPIAREGSSIETETDLDHGYDVGAELGGPILRDKLWFHVGVNPSQERFTTARRINGFVDVDMDGGNDVDPETGFAIVEPLRARDLEHGATTYFYTAKLSGAFGEDHQWQLSAWGNPRTATDLWAPEAAPSQHLFDGEDGAYDAALKWTSKLADGRSQLDVVAGYHHGYGRVIPIRATGGDAPLMNWAGERSLTDFAAAESQNGGTGVPAGCDPQPRDSNGDGTIDDQDDRFIPCPVAEYGIGGLGFLEDRDNDRLSGAIAWTERRKLSGYHTVKLGADVEQTTYDATHGFTGGVRYRQVGDSWRVVHIVRYAEGGDVPCGADQDGDGVPDLACENLDDVPIDTRNVNLAAYVQDSWQIRPNLTLNAGLRWEQQTGYTAEWLHGQVTTLGEPIPDVAFELDNMIAPRVGVIFDPTQEGRAKIFGHWGRFYESMPMDINVRAFGAEMIRRDLVTCPEAQTTQDIAVIEGCEKAPGPVFGGDIAYLAPGTDAQYLDETVLGAEYELMPDFKVGLSYVHRALPLVIEDMSADSAIHYLIANPGRDYDAVAEQLHEDALDHGLVACQADSSVSPECGLALELEARSFNVGRIEDFDVPVRTYDAVQLTANQRFSRNTLLIASYTYSRNYGDYPGLFSPETGQLDPNLTAMYDLPDMMANRYGPQGLDRPHNVKLDGFHIVELGRASRVVVGGSFRAQSGIARNTLAPHFLYGSTESFLLPRGSAARNPLTWEADVKASYGRLLRGTTRIEAFVDVFNVFDNQERTESDDAYTWDAMNPIVGGDRADLRHGKMLDRDVGIERNVTPTRNKNYGNTTAHQSPRSVRFGVRLTF